MSNSLLGCSLYGVSGDRKVLVNMWKNVKMVIEVGMGGWVE